MRTFLPSFLALTVWVIFIGKVALAQQVDLPNESPVPANLSVESITGGLPQLNWDPVSGHGPQTGLVTASSFDYSPYTANYGVDQVDWDFGDPREGRDESGQNTNYFSSYGFDVLFFNTAQGLDEYADIYTYQHLDHAPVHWWPEGRGGGPLRAKYDQLHYFNADPSSGTMDMVDVSPLGITHPDQLFWYPGDTQYIYSYLIVNDNNASPDDVASALTIRHDRTYGVFSLTQNVIYADGQTTYSIYRRTGNSGPYTLIAQGITDNSFIDNTSLTPNTSYQYVVTANDFLGESVYSNTVDFTSGNIVPPSHYTQVSDIANDTTWRTGSEIILDGYVFVKGGATLTIEPGVIIRAKDKLASNNVLPNGTYVGEISSANELTSTLVVTQTGRIEAIGTENQPIIFTAVRDDLANANDLGCDQKGMWGGITILGNAAVAPDAQTGNLFPLTYQMLTNGFQQDMSLLNYGGVDDGEDQGSLVYVSIRHAGKTIGGQSPLAGLTLAGVGSETSLDYIEVIASENDGINILGGTARIKHAAVGCVGNHAFSYGEAYRGKGQFLVALQPDFQALSCLGGTIPNNPSGEFTPMFLNATFVGNGSTQPMLAFDQNAGGNVRNSILHQDQVGVSLEYRYNTSSSYFLLFANYNDPDYGSTAVLNVGNSVFSDISNHPFFLVEDAEGYVGSTVQVRTTANATRNLADLNSGSVKNNLMTTGVLSMDTEQAYDLRPVGTFSNQYTEPVDGFFEAVPFSGAINPQAATPAGWLANWTAATLYGLVNP